jgi:hypothetical protein
MKRASILAFFCPLIFLFLVSPAFARKGTDPQIVLTEKGHDFKEVEEGSILEHTFQVINPGGEVLKIRSVNPG